MSCNCQLGLLQKGWLFLFLSILSLSSCKKHYQVNIPSYAFQDIVDSSFVLTVELDGTEREFQQLEMYSNSTRFFDDSIAISFNLRYVDSLENGRVEELVIGVTKVFNKDSLNDNPDLNEITYYIDGLTPAEYLSFFPFTDIGYISYQYADSLYSTSGYTGGSTISYSKGDFWKTDYSFMKYSSSELAGFYSETYFEIIDLHSYTDDVLYVVGEFEAIIHPWYSHYDPIELTNGYFKAYVRNVYW